KIAPINNEDRALFLKYNFIIKSPSLIWGLQFAYPNSKMNDQDLINVKYIKSYLSELEKIGSDGLLFHSLLLTSLFNSSAGFNSLLKKNSPAFKENINLFNIRKKRLY